MDRACRAGADRDRYRGGDLRRLTCLALLVLGCKELTGDFDPVVALEIVGPASPRVEEGDTLRIAARALDTAGEPIADAVIFWAVIDTGAVPFTLDTTTGLVTGTSPGQKRIQARVGTLRSAPVTVSVTARPDTVTFFGDTVINIAAASTVSTGLFALVSDLTTNPGTPLPLGQKSVAFSVASPDPGSPEAAGFFLSFADTLPGPDPHRLTLVTQGNGQAGLVIRKVTGVTLPDTAIVHAVALTARGETVPGSPVRYIVVFQAN